MSAEITSADAQLLEEFRQVSIIVGEAVVDFILDQRNRVHARVGGIEAVKPYCGYVAMLLCVKELGL